MTIFTGTTNDLLTLTLRAENARYLPDCSTHLILRRTNILSAHVQGHLHELLLFCGSVRLHAENLSVYKPFPIAAIALLHAGGAAGIVLESEGGQLMHHQWLNPGIQFAQRSHPIALGERVRPMPYSPTNCWMLGATTLAKRFWLPASNWPQLGQFSQL